MKRLLAALLVSLLASPAWAVPEWVKIADANGLANGIESWGRDAATGAVWATSQAASNALAKWDGSSLTRPTMATSTLHRGLGVLHDAFVAVVGVDAGATNARVCYSPLGNLAWVCAQSLGLDTPRGRVVPHQYGSANYLWARATSTTCHVLGSPTLGEAAALVLDVDVAASQSYNNTAHIAQLAATKSVVVCARNTSAAKGIAHLGLGAGATLYSKTYETDAELTGTVEVRGPPIEWPSRDVAIVVASDGTDSHVWSIDPDDGSNAIDQAISGSFVRAGTLATVEGTEKAYILTGANSATGTLYAADSDDTTFADAGLADVTCTSGNVSSLTANTSGRSLLAWCTDEDLWELQNAPTAAVTCTPAAIGVDGVSVCSAAATVVGSHDVTYDWTMPAGCTTPDDTLEEIVATCTTAGSKGFTVTATSSVGTDDATDSVTVTACAAGGGGGRACAGPWGGR